MTGRTVNDASTNQNKNTRVYPHLFQLLSLGNFVQLIGKLAAQ